MPRSFLVTLAVSAGVAVSAHADDVGIKILDQPYWTPLTDDETVTMPVYDPTLFSRSVREAWPTTLDRMNLELSLLLETENLIADGVSLHDVRAAIPEPELSVVGSAKVGAIIPSGTPRPVFLDATLVFDDITVDAWSVLDGELVPNEPCALVFDLTYITAYYLSEASTQPLHAGDMDPHTSLRISNFRADDAHGGCSVVAAGGLDDRLSDAVADPYFGFDPAAELNRTLSAHLGYGMWAVNDAVGPTSQVDFERVVAWAEPGQPITFARVAGDRYTDDGLRNGVIGGRFESPTDTVSCEDLPIRMARKTGPRPIISPSGDLGEVPYEDLQSTVTCWVDRPAGMGIDPVTEEVVVLPQTVAYQIDGLPDNWPTLTFTGSATGCPAESAEYTTTYVQVQGIPPRILPSELWVPRDVVADAYDVTCGAWLVEPSIDDWEDMDDPLLDPWWQVGWAYDSAISTDVLIVPVTPYAASFDFSLFGY